MPYDAQNSELKLS